MKPFKGPKYAILCDGEIVTSARFLTELKSHQIDRWLRNYALENGLESINGLTAVRCEESK